MRSVKTQLDGTTLVVRIPMRFHRRGGRKRIVAPDGSAIVPATKPQADGTLVKALARAHRWQRVLESGECGTLAELADAERISRSYVCRVLRLTLLAPDIVERNLLACRLGTRSLTSNLLPKANSAACASETMIRTPCSTS